MNHFNGKETRLEFDDGQLHSTFHDRNDGVCVLQVDPFQTGGTACDPEIAHEIAHKVNTHLALMIGLRTAAAYAGQIPKAIVEQIRHAIAVGQGEASQHFLAPVLPWDAAPQLLEALRPFADEPVGDDFICHKGICTKEKCNRCSKIIAARAAIAKAEGKQS